MVWFTFTFLLGIPNDKEEKLEDNLKKEKEKSDVKISCSEIEVSKPNFLCHIEYTLNSQEASKFIDVVCWKGAAKIYFENSTSAIIPLEVEKLRWIHFRVNHKVKLSLEDIPLFLSHKVKFTIRLGNKNFGEPAKSDKPKKFYGPKFSNSGTNGMIQKQMFQPLSETLEDLITVSYFKEHLTPQQQLYISLDTTMETSENYNKLFKVMDELSNEYHDERRERKPTAPYEDPPPLLNILQHKNDEKVAVPKKVKDTKTDKKIPGKNKEAETVEFSISGEQFLSGRKVFENCLKYNSEELPFVVCYSTIKNALSNAQATVYNPLSIAISSLNYMPVDELKKNGVTNIKFRFLICNQFLAESNLIPIGKRMKLNFARTVFTNTINKQELIYFIQTGGVNIEILGSMNSNRFNVGVIQTKVNPARNSKNLNATKEEFVVLGRVSADVSSILLQPNRVLLKCNFQPPDYYVSCNRENTHYTSTNEFSCEPGRQTVAENLLNGISCNITKSSPVLTMAVALGHPLTNIFLDVTTNPDLFNRLFAVFYNVDLAIPIIQIIQCEMDAKFGLLDFTKRGKSLKRPLTKNNSKGTVKTNCEKTRITGFTIDCTDKILLYAESSVFGGVQKIWASTSCLNPLQGHVLYDSSLIFLNRLYNNLFDFGGFIGITLREPPHVILSKPQSYNSQNLPKPAQKALLCLSLLTECKSIKTATRNNLFPDFDSLASLAIEFGVPTQISNNR